MSAFSRSISLILKGAGKAFRSFPASMACAIGFAVVTMIRVQLDWPDQEPYNFLFTCLHWGFAAGAVFSLASVTGAQSRIGAVSAIRAANLGGALMAVATFLLLYLPGGVIDEGARFARLSHLATSRVVAFLAVSVLLFILLAGHPKDRSDFSRAFFMFHKALLVALIYGGVIMAGTSGVARAVQALLYRTMSEKVYGYLGTMVGLFAFAIFVGYFPDFRKQPAEAEASVPLAQPLPTGTPPGGEPGVHGVTPVEGEPVVHAVTASTAEMSTPAGGQASSGIWWRDVPQRWETVQKQPRFIEILFGVILIPILLALTVVLLLWAVRILITGEWPVFAQLSGIAASYSLGGLWLHLMVTRHDTGLARFYRTFYPIAALVILAFEAMAFVNQMGAESLKTESYAFLLIWVLAVAAAVLLLLLGGRAHPPIALLACALAVVCVFPGVNWQSVPVAAQVARLETLLAGQGMLMGDTLTAAANEPELAVREAITDATEFIAYSEQTARPAWFARELRNSDGFRRLMGFEKVWGQTAQAVGTGYLGTSLVMAPGALDVSDYRWAIAPQGEVGKNDAVVDVTGAHGPYRIRWTPNGMTGLPSLTIELDGRVILRENLNAFIDKIAGEYPPGGNQPVELSPETMSVVYETPQIRVLLLFGNVDINVDPGRDQMTYWMNLRMLYLAEKP